MTVDELYVRFCDEFKESSILTRDSGDSEWTKSIYNYFYKLGKENSFVVYCRPNIIKAGEYEYLVDLCWSKGSEYIDYKGLELTLESEWLKGKDEILLDFCKLVDIKSAMKVMVICIKDEEINYILESMSNAIKNSSIEQKQSEEYLIIIFRALPTMSNPEQYVIEGYKIDNRGIRNKLKTADFIF